MVDIESAVNIVDLETEGEVEGREQISIPTGFPNKIQDNKHSGPEFDQFRQPRQAIQFDPSSVEHLDSDPDFRNVILTINNISDISTTAPSCQGHLPEEESEFYTYRSGNPELTISASDINKLESLIKNMLNSGFVSWHSIYLVIGGRDYKDDGSIYTSIGDYPDIHPKDLDPDDIDSVSVYFEFSTDLINNWDKLLPYISKTGEIGFELAELTTERETSKPNQKLTQHGLWADSYTDENKFEDTDKLGDRGTDDIDPMSDSVYEPYSQGTGPINSRYEDPSKKQRNIILHSNKDNEERQKWIAIDLDETILEPPPDNKYEVDGEHKFGDPIPGAKEALEELIDMGVRVSIYTARMYFAENPEDESYLESSIAAELDKHNIPYSDIYVGKKPPAHFFIDDRNIQFENNWNEIMDIIEGRLEKKAITRFNLTNDDLFTIDNNLLDDLSSGKYVEQWDENLKRFANDPVKGQEDYHGIKIDIEWPKGSIRSYEGDDTYVTLMKCDYGYVRGVEGSDGEELDIYLCDGDSNTAFVIEQLKDDGSYDEDKIVLGVDSEQEAAEIYLEHMPGYMLGPIRAVPVDKLTDALYNKPEDRRGEEDLIPSEELHKEAAIKDDLIRRYPDLREFIEDASTQVEPKYLKWFAQQLSENPNSHIQILDYIQEFKNNKNLLSKKDIYQYSLQELISEVTEIKGQKQNVRNLAEEYFELLKKKREEYQSQMERDEARELAYNEMREWLNQLQPSSLQKQVRKEIRNIIKEREKLRGGEEEAKTVSDVIYEDNNYLVIMPGTTQASKYYGSGTQWCISAEKDNVFSGYSSDNSFIYFIIDKDSNEKLAIIFYESEDEDEDEYEDEGVTEIYNSADQIISKEEASDIIDNFDYLFRLISSNAMKRPHNKFIEIKQGKHPESLPYFVKSDPLEYFDSGLDESYPQYLEQAASGLASDYPTRYFYKGLDKNYPQYLEQAVSGLASDYPLDYFDSGLDKSYPQYFEQAVSSLANHYPTRYFDQGLDEKYPQYIEQAIIDNPNPMNYFELGLDEKYPQYLEQVINNLLNDYPLKYFELGLHEKYPQYLEQAIPDLASKNSIRYFELGLHEKYPQYLEQAIPDLVNNNPTYYFDLGLDEKYPQYLEQAMSNLIKYLPHYFKLGLDEKYPQYLEQAVSDLASDYPSDYFKLGLDEKYPQYFEQAISVLVNTLYYFQMNLDEKYPQYLEQAVSGLANHYPLNYFNQGLDESYPQYLEQAMSKLVSDYPEDYFDLGLDEKYPQYLEQFTSSEELHKEAAIKDDLIARYPDLREFIEDASTQVEPKYLKWFAQQLSENPQSYIQILDYIQEFKNNKNLLSKKDIYQYSLQSLIDEVTEIKGQKQNVRNLAEEYFILLKEKREEYQSQMERDEARELAYNEMREWLNQLQPSSLQKQVRKEIRNIIKEREKLRGGEEEAKTVSDVIYEDNNYLVIMPGTTQASKYYGSGTQWCISAEENNEFSNYSNDNAFLYFIINKNSNEKLAIIFEDKGTNIYNSADQVISEEEASNIISSFDYLFNLIKLDVTERSYNKFTEIKEGEHPDLISYFIKSDPFEYFGEESSLDEKYPQYLEQAVANLANKDPIQYFSMSLNKDYPQYIEQAVSNLAGKDPVRYFELDLDEKYPQYLEQAVSNLANIFPVYYFNLDLHEEYPQYFEQAVSNLANKYATHYFNRGLDEKYPQYLEQAVSNLVNENPIHYFDLGLDEKYPQYIEQAVSSLANTFPVYYFNLDLHEEYPQYLEQAVSSLASYYPLEYFNKGLDESYPQYLEQAISYLAGRDPVRYFELGLDEKYPQYFEQFSKEATKQNIFDPGISKKTRSDYVGPSTSQVGGIGGPTASDENNWEDQIPGGLADNKAPEDFDLELLKEGIKVELEHTTDRNIAIEIAMDHLTEDPQYYKKLKRIESSKTWPDIPEDENEFTDVDETRENRDIPRDPEKEHATYRNV